MARGGALSNLPSANTVLFLGGWMRKAVIIDDLAADFPPARPLEGGEKSFLPPPPATVE